MSRLTQLRQRIQTISNLQKTTHAMRLTSMSSHSGLQKQKHLLTNYKKEIEQIVKQLQTQLHTKLSPESSQASIEKNPFLIIVGSQKGLCGAFNTRIMNFVEENYALKKNKNNYRIISIGKKVTDYLEQRGITPLAAYNTFNPNNFVSIAHELCAILETTKDLAHVTIFSNQPRTFFVQESMATELTIPKSHHKGTNSAEAALQNKNDTSNEEFYEEPPEELCVYVEQLHMKVAIQELLFKSLIAEQAARFISMDSSTRNAEQLIAEMKIDYNKLRQALITRELTDLAGGIL